MEIVNAQAAQLLADFEKAVSGFSKIQDEHVMFLQLNQLADIDLMNDERSRAMGQLQQALSAMWGCDFLRADARLGRSLQQRIGVIVEREMELAANAKKCKKQLEGEMGKIRRGKKVMGRYGAIAPAARSTGLCFRNTF